MKKSAVYFIIVCLLLCTPAVTFGASRKSDSKYVLQSQNASKKSKYTLKKTKGKYYCYNKKGKKVKNKLLKVGGKYYYFDKSGKAYTKGLKKVSGEWYFFKKNGQAIIKEFKKVKVKGKKYTYYFGKNGKAYKAKKNIFIKNDFKTFKIKGKYYGFDEEAHMITGIWVSEKGKISFFDKNGVKDKVKSKELTEFNKWGSTSETLDEDIIKLFGKPDKKTIREGDLVGFTWEEHRSGPYWSILYSYPNLLIQVAYWQDKEHLDNPENGEEDYFLFGADAYWEEGRLK